MRHIQMLFVAIALCGFGGCSPALCFSKKPPVQDPVPVESPKAPETVDAYAGRELIFDIATKDLCSKAEHKSQGTPPASYMKGLALTYVKTICAPESDVYKIGSQTLGVGAKDALTHYGLSPKTPEERLNMVFAMMIGSNAHESSWRPCVGRDTMAKASDVKGCLYGGGETCEAGLAQTSFNSIPKAGPLKDLFDSFSEYPTGCFRTEYYGKITCSEANLKNHGTNPKAVQFQRMSKECPGFTVESGVIMFRTNRSHYYPINSKKAQVFPACVAMFERIRQAVVKDPSLCLVL